MLKAKEVAIWFLAKNNSEIKEHEAVNDDYEVYEGITHLKLQKLLYYAQGVYVAITGKKLFEEEIEAWQHGPVVADIYNLFKSYGKNNITLQLNDREEETVRKIENNREISEILNMVYDNFAIYTAWQLREMTHVKNGPWDKAITSEHKVIDINDIKQYFESEVIVDG